MEKWTWAPFLKLTCRSDILVDNIRRSMLCQRRSLPGPSLEISLSSFGPSPESPPAWQITTLGRTLVQRSSRLWSPGGTMPLPWSKFVWSCPISIYYMSVTFIMGPSSSKCKESHMAVLFTILFSWQPFEVDQAKIEQLAQGPPAFFVTQ